MPDELEVGDRAPNFELPACYGYKAGASSPSAEEKVKVSLKDFEDKKWVVLDLDTSEGMKQAAFYDAWAGHGWRKVSGILTPTWTGTLHGVYWKVGTEDVTDDFYIDDALLVEGTGPPQVTMRPAAGTWRQEIEQ